MADEVTLAEMVRNGTLNAEMAAVLWAAVDERVSFVTVAIPQLAGKSTLAEAVLALRRDDVPVHKVAGEPAVMERLKQQRSGGYLVVGEFSHAPVPGYIWGAPVRRVFDTLEAGYSLQTSLHAPSPEAAMQEIVSGNGVTEDLASRIKLILYIERFGEYRPDFWRRLAQVYELHKIENGKCIGHPLYRWQRETDSFEKVSDPHQWGRDRVDLSRRAELMQRLASQGRTSSSEVALAVAEFRAAEGTYPV